MARSLFSSTAAPCLKCHATGDAQHDKTATAPNFLLAKERLKPDWVERWIIDPQAISPGTSMPSGLFRRENEHWVFAGPTPPSFQGYDRTTEAAGGLHHPVDAGRAAAGGGIHGTHAAPSIEDSSSSKPGAAGQGIAAARLAVRAKMFAGLTQVVFRSLLNTIRKVEIMNRMKTWLAMFSLCILGLWMLAGCSKKENTNEEQTSSPTSEAKPAPASAPIDPATAASVSGTVKFDGTAPKPAKIDMSQDPACKGTNQSETWLPMAANWPTFSST